MTVYKDCAVERRKAQPERRSSFPAGKEGQTQHPGHRVRAEGRTPWVYVQRAGRPEDCFDQQDRWQDAGRPRSGSGKRIQRRAGGFWLLGAVPAAAGVSGREPSRQRLGQSRCACRHCAERALEIMRGLVGLGLWHRGTYCHRNPDLNAPISSALCANAVGDRYRRFREYSIFELMSCHSICPYVERNSYS